MSTDNPILNPVEKTHVDGDFTRHEVELANRNSGTLLETLRYDVTPAGAHYLLNHFDIPFVENAGDWQLAIEGCVEKPAQWSLAQLSKLPSLTQRVTLECAGNGRNMVRPRWPSQPWGYEAVGTADWTGTSLQHLLNAADIRPQCTNVVFHGTDRGVDGGEIHGFSRSLSLQQALHSDVMLAWQMNGQPLPPQHGFPLRLVMPGWYGMASVKWLDRIEFIDHEFTGFQQVKTYRYRQKKKEAGIPITAIRVKSLLVPPGIPDWVTRKRLIEPGKVTITGRAWSGEGVAVEKVEFGADGEWTEATLERCDDRYAWTRWHCDWHATPGVHELSCRATDAQGNTQPLQPLWDAAGMGNNAVHKIEVWCE